MSAHALLSPSSAYRWLNCPKAPRLEALLPERTSDFAREGTLAHTICEITAKKRFGKMHATEYTKALKKAKSNQFWNDEMLHTAEQYVEHLEERAMGFTHEPYITFEVSIDLADYVPEAFGRCDCVMFGNDTLIITDYKHGKGVKVNAEKNPQLMLYALGALKLYQPIFGGAIKNVTICIDQPRLDSYETWPVTADDLFAWGEEIKPKAQMAWKGQGEYRSGDWCQFCRANGKCLAQAQQQTSAFDDFSEAVGQSTDLLQPAQLSAVLKLGANLVAWYDAVKQTALDTLLAGTPIPDFKVVEGRSSRAWSDQDKALETLQASGIDRALIYDTVPKTLAQLEKMLGKPKFQELVGQFVIKPQGRPTLATASDKRKEYSSAATDFAAVAK